MSKYVTKQEINSCLLTSEEEIPAVCERCLGSNPYLKMVKESQGAQCRLCTRPFTVFRWNISKGSKFSRTIICLTCARQRNCCQACMLDLTYGILIQMRDAAFKMAGIENPYETAYSSNEVTKRYVAQREDQKYSGRVSGTVEDVSEDAKLRKQEALKKAEEIMKKLASAQNYSDGDNGSPSLAKASKDERFNPEKLKSVDVTKILAKLPLNGNLDIPKETSLKTFFIFGINDEITNVMVADAVDEKVAPLLENRKQAKLESVILHNRAKCGYITFERRQAAEAFANSLKKHKGVKGPGIFIVKNVPIRVAWGKVRSVGTTNLEHAKIGQIIRKQMKLLADKETGKSKAKDNSSFSKKKSSSQRQDTNTYASLRSDFEV